MKLLINETEPAFMSLSCAEYKRINIDFLIKQSFKAAQDGRQRTCEGAGGVATKNSNAISRCEQSQKTQETHETRVTN